ECRSRCPGRGRRGCRSGGSGSPCRDRWDRCGRCRRRGAWRKPGVRGPSPRFRSPCPCVDPSGVSWLAFEVAPETKTVRDLCQDSRSEIGRGKEILLGSKKCKPEAENATGAALRVNSRPSRFRLRLVSGFEARTVWAIVGQTFLSAPPEPFTASLLSGCPLTPGSLR